jgi:serine/threonine protein phosphatase PrpC
MHLVLLASASVSPGAVNDDRMGYDAAGSAAWVLDGATGLTRERVLPGPSDASWFVDEIGTALGEAVRKGGATRALLDRATAHAAERFRAAALRPEASPEHMPCASLVMARLLDGDRLELVNLGDCGALVRRAGERGAVTFGTSRLRDLDAVSEREMAGYLAAGLSQAEAFERLRPTLLRHRATMNRPDGYWILDLTGRGLDHLERTEVAAGEGDLVLLVSDGFSRLVDTYHRYDPAGLLDRVSEAEGVPRLLAELRAIERADPDCRTHLRIKPSDDATAMLLRVER